MSKASKTLSKIVTYMLVVLLCLGAAGCIISIIQKLTENTGLYIEYDGKQYFSGDSITITSEEFSYVDLYLNNTEGWGDYSATDYEVRVVPYNTDEYDFYYSVNDTRYTFSSTSDLSAGFTYDYADYDGNGLQVSDDGAIGFYINNIVYESDSCNMKSLLTYVWYHSFTSSDDSVSLLTSYPDFTEGYCFAFSVISPDGETEIEVPFRLDITNVATDEDDDDDDSTGSGSGSGSGGSGSSGSGGTSGSDTSYSGAGDSSTEDSSTEDSSTEDSSTEDSSTEDSSTEDSSGDDEEEVSTAITYNLYNVTAQCDLPSSVEDITDDEVTLTFAVNDGYHMTDCSYDAVTTDYVKSTSDGGALVGYVYIPNSVDDYYYEVADEIVTIIIAATDLDSSFSITVGAEKTHYIYLYMSGCYLNGYTSVSGYDMLFYDYEYHDRDPLCVKYYYSYYHAELVFVEEDGYSFWYYTDEDLTDINYDNYSYSFTTTGDLTAIQYACDGYNDAGVWFGIYDRSGQFSDEDWSITIHITCYEEVVYDS